MKRREWHKRREREKEREREQEREEGACASHARGGKSRGRKRLVDTMDLRTNGLCVD